LTFPAITPYIFTMKKIAVNDGGGESGGKKERESNWCEKYSQFIDLDACSARSLHRPVCRRCYQSLIQTKLPFEKS